MKDRFLFCAPIQNNQCAPQKLYIYCNTYNLKKAKDCLKGNIHLSFSSEFNDPFDAMFDQKFQVSWFCKTNPAQMYDTILARLWSIRTVDAVEEYRKMECISKERFVGFAKELVSFEEAIDVFNALLPKNEIYQVKKDLVISLIEDAINERNPAISYPCTIACFSDKFDSIPMWAYYGNNQGVCIEYDLSLLDESVESQKRIKESIFQVQYSDDRPVDNMSTISDSYFHKSSAWAHENEWRIVSLSQAENVYLPCVSRIYLGVYFSKNSCEKKKTIFDLLCKKNIPVYKMVPNQSVFALEAVEYELEKYERLELTK